jgi:hypothetical protein
MRAATVAGYGAGMENVKKVAFVLLGVLIVVGGLMVVIYYVQGGNGESQDIPGQKVVAPLVASAVA